MKVAPSLLSRRVATGSVLLIGQLAVSLALVAAGGLFARAAVNATGADAGYPLERQIVVGLDPSLAGYDQPRTRAIYAAILERVRALPGVERASFASTVAFGDVQMSGLVGLPATDQDVDASLDIIGADYFEALGLRVLRGRGFTSAEEQRDHPAPTAIVDAGLCPAALRRRGSDRTHDPRAHPPRR